MNEEKGLVSIIVPVYNIEDYLPKCLDTIARQTYRKLEIILVDDGSTDGTGLLCDQFAERDPRAFVIHHKENKQLWAARNSGQFAAHGEYIMFVDGDDYLHLDAIKTMHEAINRDGGYDMAIINYKVTSSLTEDIETNCANEYVSLTQDELLDGVFQRWANVWTKLYRHDVIRDTWAKEYERAQDVDFSFRSFLQIERAIWIKSVLYFYFQRTDSAVHKSGAQILGVKCVVQLMYDNLVNLPTDKVKYQYLLLKKLYERMVDLINLSWETPERNATLTQCQSLETKMHRRFWNDPHFRTIQRIALCANIRYPYTIRLLKRITNNHLSWPRFS